MIPLFKVSMEPNVDAELLRVLHSGWIGQGEKTEEFEREIGERINNPLCLSLSSGTHGLTLALRLIDIKNKSGGGSIVTTPLTCFATVAPILDNRAEVIWADVREDLNIDPESVREKIRKDTKAILFVHWGGYAADLEKLFEISKEYNIPLIEDAAHSFGSYYKGHPIGDCYYSEYGIFSWQAIKNLTSVDGGMLFVNNEEDYEIGKLLRWFGITREGAFRDLRCREDIIYPGYKFHMNDVCATIGLENLKGFDKKLKKTRENAAYYEKALADIPGITLPQTEKDRRSSYWLFSILVEDRTGFARKMGESQIAVSQVHARTDKHSCMQRFKTFLPGLERIAEKYCCIPVGWWVTREEREFIAETIQNGW